MDSLLERLRSPRIGGTKAVLVRHEAADRIESLTTEIAELRAQMLSDQERHDAEMGRLMEALTDLDDMIFNDDQVIESAGLFRKRIHEALFPEAVKDSLTSVPAETRVCPTCHRKDGSPIMTNLHGRCPVCRGTGRVPTPAETPRICETCSEAIEGAPNAGKNYRCRGCPQLGYLNWTAKPNIPGDDTDKTLRDA